MTGKETTHDDSSPPGRLISRRSVLAGSAIAVLGVGAGVGLGAVIWRQPEPAAGSAPIPVQRLGAMVGLPVDDADVDRWREDIDTLAEQQQTLVRTGIYAWKVAPEPEVWVSDMAAFYREHIDYAHQRGLGINMVVPGAPDWAQSYGFDEYVAACTWFWTQMRESYGDQVQLWQAFNEADHAHYQTFTPATRDDAYLNEWAQLLGVAQETLGSDGKPVSTNLTGWPMNDEREEEWFQVLDVIGDSLDIIGIDLYPADNTAEIALLPDRLNRVLERYQKPVFVAEIGLQTTEDSWNEEEQERYVSAAIEQLRSVSLWGIALYELRDNDARPGFGIKRIDGTHKLGFPEIMQALAPR